MSKKGRRRKEKSAARVAAGRINGQLGAGKKSEESRQKCAMNAVKHGMTANAIVLANESKEMFEAVHTGLHNSFNPANEAEEFCVRNLAVLQWRITRGWNAEKETIDLRQARMDHSGELKREFKAFTEMVRIAVGLNVEYNQSKTLETLSRHEARLHRQYLQTSAELRRLQEDRRARELEEMNEEIDEEIDEEEIVQNEGNEGPKSTPNLVEMPLPPFPVTLDPVDITPEEVEKEPPTSF